MELDVLIIDCQTTGASPAFGSVLELGWALTRASEPLLAEAQAHWIRLPEGEHVPRQIRKITGYQPAHSSLAIEAEDAWQRLRASAKRAPAAPTAIHYARFELPFLRDWSARFEPEAGFSIDAVCVHAVALRLYPDLPRQSLRALAGYLGHGLDLTRRSLGHVEATAFVWRKQCVELALRGIHGWEDLRAWLAESAPRRARPKKPKYPIASDRYKELPDAPGVYRFLRSNGDVLYVGKAASLKKRVTSHFMARGGTTQAPEMLTQVSRIEVTLAASALEAALLENELIKTLRPPYNVQLSSSDPRVWYSSRDFQQAVPTQDPEHPIGPLPSAYALSPLQALVALLEGRAATAQLRSQVVGVSDLWTPEEGVFANGFARFIAHHSLAEDADSPRKRALRVARRLLLELARAKSGDDELATGAQKPPGWDPERVQRHIERAAAQAYQAYRRARFLALLQHSEILYREPGAAGARRILVEQAERVGAWDALPSEFEPSSGAGHTLGSSCPTPVAEPPRLQFDRLKYDRLRILTTELKRIARDGGEVAIRRGAARPLPAHLLPGLLRLV